MEERALTHISSSTQVKRNIADNDNNGTKDTVIGNSEAKKEKNIQTPNKKLAQEPKKNKEKKWDQKKFAENFNEFGKRGLSLVLFFICSAFASVFPFFILSALGFMFRATLPDKTINNSLNNKNGVIKAISRILYGSTGVGLVKHIDKFITNKNIEVNSKKGYISDTITATPETSNNNKKISTVKKEKNNSKEEKVDELKLGKSTLKSSERKCFQKKIEKRNEARDTDIKLMR